MFSASREASAAKDVATHQWVPLPQIDDENAPYKPIGEASVDEVVAKKLCKQPPDPVKIKSARDKWEASAHFTGKAVFAFGASYITCHYTYNGKEFSRQFPDRGGPSSNSCPAMIDPPQQGEQTTVPAASSSTGALADAHVRPDPQHPLRIGEDWYPQASIRLKEEGRCVVTITVAADGHIASESLQTSSGFPRLDEACLKAFHGQRMLPAIENGKPVETTVAIPIDWHRPQ
jgi:TonB family protein